LLPSLRGPAHGARERACGRRTGIEDCVARAVASCRHDLSVIRQFTRSMVSRRNRSGKSGQESRLALGHARGGHLPSARTGRAAAPANHVPVSGPPCIGRSWHDPFRRPDSHS
jgi:hypothetical protein